MAKLFLFATILLLAAPRALSAEAPPPSNSASPPLPDCDSVVMDMISCLDYVLEGSKQMQPDPGCCDGLQKVVQHSPTCLCEGLNKASDLGYAVNMTRAPQLPQECNVEAPGLGNCGVSPTPAPAPTLTQSPSPSPSTAPSQLSPPAPSPAAPPVSAQLSPPAPSPAAPPVSAPPQSESPQTLQPSLAPRTSSPVASPSEAQAPSASSATSELPSSLRLLAGVSVACLAYLVV